MYLKNAIVIVKVFDALLHYYKNIWPRDLVNFYICSPLDFHAQTMNWDCGYRNMQTILSCYLNHDSKIRDQLFSCGIFLIPTIVELQKKIEYAWIKGFDQVGGMQLEYTLIGTSKWIGATEVVAMFRSSRIRACIADFDFTTGQCDLNSMVQIIWEYFQSRCKNNNLQSKFQKLSESNFVAPLYLQHQGHSRLVVGVEKWINGDIKLLILDPQVKKFSLYFQKDYDEDIILRQGNNARDLNTKCKYQVGYLSEKSLYYDEKENARVIVDELRHPKLKFF